MYLSYKESGICLSKQLVHGHELFGSFVKPSNVVSLIGGDLYLSYKKTGICLSEQLVPAHDFRLLCQPLKCIILVNKTQLSACLTTVVTSGHDFFTPLSSPQM